MLHFFLIFLVVLIAMPGIPQAALLWFAVIADLVIIVLVIGNLIYPLLVGFGWIKKED